MKFIWFLIRLISGNIIYSTDFRFLITTCEKGCFFLLTVVYKMMTECIPRTKFLFDVKGNKKKLFKETENHIEST